MKHRLPLLVTLTLILASGFYFLPTSVSLTDTEFENPLEENAARTALEKAML